MPANKGRIMTRLLLVALLLLNLLSLSVFAEDPSRDAKWPNAPEFSDPNYFPLAVWLQDPKNAPKYKNLGINLYIGLWKGPTEAQLTALDKAQMPVICEMNDFALKNLSRKIIVGWMHGDEPDNAQSLPSGKGYGPPIPLDKILADYQKLRAADPSRPILLNLGQGVAWDGWYGRGVRTNHPEDYAGYVQGGDIVSFDIYPAVSTDKAVAGKLQLIPFGVDRLRRWSEGKRIVWNCIETTRISNENRKPTPDEVRAEVWMSIIHGSRGIIYFTHEFKPKFIEAGLLADAEMARDVGELNRQITQLAPVINSAEPKDPARVTSSKKDVPIDVMTRRHNNGLYVFAVSMGSQPTRGKFILGGAPASGEVEVIGEDRRLPLKQGQWEDDFAPYSVHLYRFWFSLPSSAAEPQTPAGR